MKSTFNRKHNKIIAILLLVILSFSCIYGLCGCSAKIKNDGKKALNIVTTIFPLYDFAQNVCGDECEVIQLLKPGTESHSFEPTPQDMITISKADLFIYIGGENDTWIEELLGAMDKRPETLIMMDYIELLEEETAEGMQEERGGHEHEEEAEYDEHIWTSPANAMKMIEVISDKICEMLDDDTLIDAFNANSETYIAEIGEIHEGFEEFFKDNKEPLIFGDRFPFLYFAREYGVEYYAAFPGCYAGSEPSAKTMSFLINKASELHTLKVYYIEFSNVQVANAIAEATGAHAVLFHSCHNVTQAEIDAGVSYADLMRQNLQALRARVEL